MEHITFRKELVMENNFKFCSQCGKPLAPEAKFCASCGAAQSTNAAPAPEAPAPAPEAPAYTYTAPANEAPAYQAEPAPEAPAKGGNFLTRCLTPLIVASLAFIMLITAFCPILKIDKSEDWDLKGAYLKVSAFNATQLMLDSFKEVEDYQDLYDSALYEKYEEQYEKLYDRYEDELDEIDDVKNFNELPAGLRKAMNKITFMEMRLGHQISQEKTNIATIVSGLMGLAYIAISIAFFVVALIKLIKALTSKDEENDGSQAKVNRLFLAVPMVLAFAFFAFKMSLCAYGLSAAKVSVAGGAAFTFVIVALAVSASVVLGIVLNLSEAVAKIKANLMKLIGAGVSLLLSVLILFALSAPVLNATVTAEFDGRSKKTDAKISVDSSFFAGLQLTEEQKEYADEMADLDHDDAEYYVEDAFEEFEDYSVSEIKKGEADYENRNFIGTVAIIGGLYKANVIFGLISVLYLVAFAFALVSLWNTLSSIVNEKAVGKSFAVANIAIIGTALILAFAFMFVINGAVEKYGVSGYSLGIGFGIIAALLLAIGAKVAPSILFKGQAPAPVAPEAPEAQNYDYNNTNV